MTTEHQERAALAKSIEAHQKEQTRLNEAAAREAAARRDAEQAQAAITEREEARYAAWRATLPGKVARAQEAVKEAEAAFRLAVVQDFPNAVAAYLAWTDARALANVYSRWLGRDFIYADHPRFAQEIERLLYSAASQRYALAEARVGDET